MLGMSFLSFLILSLIGAVVACAYHFAFRYRFLEGTAALFGKLVVGWVGAWLGSPVLGHWFWKVENVYVVPAILGARHYSPELPGLDSDGQTCQHQA